MSLALAGGQPRDVTQSLTLQSDTIAALTSLLGRTESGRPRGTGDPNVDAGLDTIWSDTHGDTTASVTTAQNTAVNGANDVQAANGSSASVSDFAAKMHHQRDEQKQKINESIDKGYEKAIALGTDHPGQQDQILGSMDDLGKGLVSVINNLGSALMNIAQSILNILAKILEAIGNFFAPVIQMIGNLFGAA
jgi:hypothetical protein